MGTILFGQVSLYLQANRYNTLYNGVVEGLCVCVASFFDISKPQTSNNCLSSILHHQSLGFIHCRPLPKSLKNPKVPLTS